MPIPQVTEIDRCIMYLRQQARENLLLANELEAKHCKQVNTKKEPLIDYKALIKKVQARE